MPTCVRIYLMIYKIYTLLKSIIEIKANFLVSCICVSDSVMCMYIHTNNYKAPIFLIFINCPQSRVFLANNFMVTFSWKKSMTGSGS